MKNMIHGLVLVGLMLSTPIMAEERNPNPTNDPDVQRGYDEHQREYRERQERQQQPQQKNEDVERGQEQGQKDLEDFSETHSRQQNK